MVLYCPISVEPVISWLNRPKYIKKILFSEAIPSSKDWFYFLTKLSRRSVTPRAQVEGGEGVRSVRCPTCIVAIKWQAVTRTIRQQAVASIIPSAENDWFKSPAVVVASRNLGMYAEIKIVNGLGKKRGDSKDALGRLGAGNDPKSL